MILPKQNIIVCYWILLNIIEYYWTLLNITEYYWILLNTPPQSDHDFAIAEDDRGERNHEPGQSRSYQNWTETSGNYPVKLDSHEMIFEKKWFLLAEHCEVAKDQFWCWLPPFLKSQNFFGKHVVRQRFGITRLRNFLKYKSTTDKDLTLKISSVVYAEPHEVGERQRNLGETS